MSIWGRLSSLGAQVANAIAEDEVAGADAADSLSDGQYGALEARERRDSTSSWGWNSKNDDAAFRTPAPHRQVSQDEHHNNSTAEEDVAQDAAALWGSISALGGRLAQTASVVKAVATTAAKNAATATPGAGVGVPGGAGALLASGFKGLRTSIVQATLLPDEEDGEDGDGVYHDPEGLGFAAGPAGARSSGGFDGGFGDDALMAGGDGWGDFNDDIAADDENDGSLRLADLAGPSPPKPPRHVGQRDSGAAAPGARLDGSWDDATGGASNDDDGLSNVDLSDGPVSSAGTPRVAPSIATARPLGPAAPSPSGTRKASPLSAAPLYAAPLASAPQGSVAKPPRPGAPRGVHGGGDHGSDASGALAASLRAEVSNLRGQLDAAAGQLADARDSAEAERRRAESFRSHAAALEGRLAAEQEAADGTERELRSALGDAQAALGEARAAHAHSLHELRGSFESRLARATAAAEDAQQERGTLESRVQALTLALAEAREQAEGAASARSGASSRGVDRAALETAVQDALRAQASSHELEMASVRKSVASLDQRLTEATAELVSAHGALQVERERVSSLEAAATMASAASAEADDAQEARLQELQRELSAAGNHTRAVEAQAAQSTSALQGEVARLAALLDSVHSEGCAQTTALASAQAAADESAARAAQLTARIAELQQEANARVAALTTATNERIAVYQAEFEARLAGAKEAAESDGVAAKARADEEIARVKSKAEEKIKAVKDKAKESLERMAQELEAARTSAASSSAASTSDDASVASAAAEAAATIALLRAEVASLRVQLDEAREALAEATERAADAKEALPRQLAQAQATATATLSVAQAQTEALVNELHSSKQQSSTLSFELAETQATVTALQQQLASFATDAEAQLQAAQDEIARLAAELTYANECAASREGAAGDAAATATSLQQQLAAALDDLAAERSSRAAAEAEQATDRASLGVLVSEAQGRVAGLEQQVKRAVSELADAQQQLEVQAGAHAEAMAQLEAQLAATQDEVASLRQAGESATAAAAGEAATLRRALDDTLEQLSLVQQECAQRDAQICELRSALARAEAAAHSASESDTSQVMTLTSQLSASQDQLASVASELSSLRAQMASYGSELESARGQAQGASDAYRRLQGSYERLQAELREGMGRETALGRELEREQDRLAEAQALASNLRSALDHASREGSATGDALAQARGESASLRSDVAALTERMASLQAAAATLPACHSRIAQLESELEEAHAAESEAGSHWGERERALLAALATAEARVAEGTGHADEVARLRADLALRDADLASAQESQGNLQLAVDALAAGQGAATASLQARVSALVQENDGLKRELEAAKAAAAAAAAPAPSPTGGLFVHGPPGSPSRAGHGASREPGSPRGGLSGYAHLPPEVLANKLEQAQVRNASLQQRLHELRSALGDAQARTLDASSQQVDRRVVAALLLQFLSLQRRSGNWSGYGTHRARDALLILSNMLGLSDDQRNEAGCHDDVVGPGAAGVSMATGVAGLVSSVLLGSGSNSHSDASAHAPVVSKAAPADAGPPPALGAAFAQFLLDELGEQ